MVTQLRQLVENIGVDFHGQKDLPLLEISLVWDIEKALRNWGDLLIAPDVPLSVLRS